MENEPWLTDDAEDVVGVVGRYFYINIFPAADTGLCSSDSDGLQYNVLPHYKHSELNLSNNSFDKKWMTLRNHK